MVLVLRRTDIRRDTTDGYLSISGGVICDTAEHTPVMLAPGRYRLSLRCFYFIHGNGVYALSKPQIIVGKNLCPGVVLHSRDAFLALYQRIRKALLRRSEVWLVVEE